MIECAWDPSGSGIPPDERYAAILSGSLVIPSSLSWVALGIQICIEEYFHAVNKSSRGNGW